MALRMPTTPSVPQPTAFSTKREADLTVLYNQGHASADTFLRAAFGGALPRNLDIVNVPEYNLEFKNAASDPLFYLSAAFRAFADHWGKLGVMYFLNMPRMAIGLAAGAVALSLVSIRGYVRPGLHPERVHINDIWAAVRLFDKDNEGFANTVAHEGWHTAQAYDDRVSLSSAFHENRHGMRMLFPKEMSRWLKYLSSEAELGARMFTVVSNAYVQHGVMPLTKHELWGCLISQGLEAPHGVLARAQDNAACARAFHKFPTVDQYVQDHADRSAANNLNDVTDGMDNDAARFKLWDQVLPWVYGDILEVMGDRYGHKRMGHGHNIQLREIFMKTARGHMDKPTAHEQVMQDMRTTARKMCADDAKSLLEIIAGGFPYKELSADSIRIPEGPTRLMAVYALAAHPGIDNREAGRIVAEASGYDVDTWRQRMLNPPTSRIKRTIRLRPTRSRGEMPSLEPLPGFGL